MFSLDCETTGIDMHHGSKPFFVTVCDEEDNITYWEWFVNPLTREPIIPTKHLAEIDWLISHSKEELVLQNARFDIRALQTLGLPTKPWPWERTHDTLIAGHMLASNLKHDLTSMARQYLGVDILPLEKALEEAVKECRRLVQQARLARGRGNPKSTTLDSLANWRISEEGAADQPSLEKGWLGDYWLPRIMASFLWEGGDITYKPPLEGVKIISGGQTGVDEAALEAASQSRLVTGGMAPLGWRTLSDPNPVLGEKYGLTESDRSDYPTRTARNILDSEATVQIFENPNSPGEILTARLARQNKRPLLQIPLSSQKDPEKTIFDWLVKGGYKVVNFAGNAEQTCKGIYQKVFDLLLKVFQGHSWWTVLRDYSNADSAVTIRLIRAQMEEIERRKLGKIYAYMLTQLEPFHSMEEHGVNISKKEMDTLTKEYEHESLERGNVCTNIATTYGYELKLPKGSNNDNLKVFAFDEKYLNLPPIKKSKKTGVPSLDKDTMGHYNATLPEHSRAGRFVSNLLIKRKLDTSLSYLESYRRFWKQIEGQEDWYKLWPSINMTGTDTLRCSSQNPNQQNVSKKQDKRGRTLRDCMGPTPGREWWSMDYENIELRIPAYVSGERSMIELFEKPNDPPYFGSYHLMNASIIYPDLFWPLAEEKGAFKKKYNSTWYQWCKNFGFAVQYGAMPGSGTADRAAHKPGAHQMVADGLKEMTKLNKKMIAQAEKYGYVESLPDKTIDPNRGYPLLCTRTEWGRILPTVPLSYFVQSTAMWCTRKAMVRCEQQLKQWRAKGFDAYMVMQVHDEIVFEFPAGGKHNLTRATVLRRLMEKSGEDIGIPLTVSMSYHPKNWGKEQEL